MIVLTGIYLIMAWNLPRFAMTTVVDAHVFPMFIGITQMFLCIWLWVISKDDSQKNESPWKSLELKGGVFLLVLAALYIELLETLGFILATFGFLSLAPLALGWKKWGVSTILAALLSISMYYVFNVLLMVPLPKGILGL
jgi:putative tricarboxylic transport membrane protein